TVPASGTARRATLGARFGFDVNLGLAPVPGRGTLACFRPTRCTAFFPTSTFGRRWEGGCRGPFLFFAIDPERSEGDVGVRVRIGEWSIARRRTRNKGALATCA